MHRVDLQKCDPHRGQEPFFKQRVENIASAGKRAKKGGVGGCNAHVGAPGAAARGHTQFHSGILVKKKKARPTTGKHRGSAGEPPRITLSGSMAPGMLLIKIN